MMATNRHSFPSVEIDKNYSFTLPRWKSLCQRWSRDKPQPGSFSQRQRELVQREPGDEVDTHVPRYHGMYSFFCLIGGRVLGFHRWRCLIHICDFLRRKVPHLRTHSSVPNSTPLDSSPHRSLSQFLSRDHGVLCLMPAP